MKTLYKKTISTYIGALVLFFALLTIVLFLFKRVQMRIVEVRVVNEKIASIEKYEGIYLQELEKIKNLEERLAFLDREIITESTLPLVLSNIEQLAKQSSVVAEITSAKVVTTKEKSSYGSIDIKAEGSFDNLTRFMKKIEQSRNEAVLQTFTLTGNVEKDQQLANQWDLSATIDILSYK